MKKKSISISVFSLLLFSVILAASHAQEPLRGRALYEKMHSSRELVPFEGQRNLQWTPDGSAYYRFEEGTFIMTDVRTGKEAPLFDDKKILASYNRIASKGDTILPFERFTFLDGGGKIRFMVGAKAYIYDLEKGDIISYVPQFQRRGVRGRMYGEVLSPDLTYRAYTRDYNLYIADFQGNEWALTIDGHSDLRNGIPDWVYPEELGQYEAFWWSPDSAKIAFMQFDESPVAKYPIVHDTAPKPELEMQSYPKAGANNPIIHLYIVDIETKDIVRIETGLDTNVYLFGCQWTPDGKELLYLRMNRLQNKLEIFAANPLSGKVRPVMMEEDPCYVETEGDLHFLEDNRHFLWTSERSGWREIYLYDLQGKLVRQLTTAKLPVNSILGVDQKKGWVYFCGCVNRGLEEHTYRVNIDGTGFTRLTEEPGRHSTTFSPDALFFVDRFSSFDTPTRVTLHRADGTRIKELGKATPSEEFRQFKLIKPEHFTFKSADGKVDLDGILYYPAHFDEKEKYPLIMSVYGGPGSKRVYNRYLMDDSNQEVAQLGFIVASVDHRGISRRGKAFQNLMYMNLGQIELEDHVAAVQHLIKRPYIDGSRVGIQGHSYGGYLTCIALLKAPDVFHVGVAGAPVTDWRNYDTIYTERYMRRPQDNPDGYEKASCMNYAQDLKGKLAIHHGAVDNNVHPGNSIQLLYALLQKEKRVDFMLYPEQQHGIRFQQYPQARVEYFIQHLKPDVK